MLALAVLGFVHSIWLAAIVMAVFFAAYFVAYEPYRALYPDLVDDEIAGRAQSSQAIFRGLGTFLALLGGGLLFSISAPLPFVAAGDHRRREPDVVLARGRPPPAPRASPTATSTSATSPSASSTSSAATGRCRRSSWPTRSGSWRWRR